MTANKRCTGYPSVDKPWLEYYTEAEINATVNRCSIYDKIYENGRIQYEIETFFEDGSCEISYYRMK